MPEQISVAASEEKKRHGSEVVPYNHNLVSRASTSCICRATKQDKVPTWSE